jgi:hypothetical protein
MPPSPIAQGMRSAIAILCIFACPLIKAQTTKTSSPTSAHAPAQQQPNPQSGGGWIALGLPSPVQEGTTAYENGWFRGSASLSKANGVVDFRLRMATDSLTVGPKARMRVALRDSNDKELPTLWWVKSAGEAGSTARPKTMATSFVVKLPFPRRSPRAQLAWISQSKLVVL